MDKIIQQNLSAYKTPKTKCPIRKLPVTKRPMQLSDQCKKTSKIRKTPKLKTINVLKLLTLTHTYLDVNSCRYFCQNVSLAVY